MNKSHYFSLASLASMIAIEPALAHHVMDSALPQTFMQGLLSGVGHPVIGIDHLAFVIGVGVVAAFRPSPWRAPLGFVGGTLLGCLFMLNGASIPMTEIAITGSVFLLGVFILSAFRLGSTGWFLFFVSAGLAHGFAYGESIVGAENTPLVAYLIGFALIQYVICIVVTGITRTARQANLSRAMGPRLTGAIIAGVGIAFLVEHLEAALFA